MAIAVYVSRKMLECYSHVRMDPAAMIAQIRMYFHLLAIRISLI